jgi:hypothetical protein
MKNTQTSDVSALQTKAVQAVPRYGFEFYRDGFRRLVSVSVVLVILDCLLVFGMYLVYTHYPSPDVYAATRRGMLSKLKPVTGYVQKRPDNPAVSMPKN